MSIVKINNIFSEDEYSQIIQYIENKINNLLNESDLNGKNQQLGRYQMGNIPLNKFINDKIIDIAKKITGKNLEIDHCLYVEYSKNFGQPNLPPHFDGDTNELVIDFQLSSNTSWDLGIGTKQYALEDNSALIFNPNKSPHWRPYKTFLDGESIKMLFWRLYDPHNRIDYSHIKYHHKDPIFYEINKIRDKGTCHICKSKSTDIIAKGYAIHFVCKTHFLLDQELREPTQISFE